MVDGPGAEGRSGPARLQPVLDEVRPLADRFAGAGFRTYLVGGTVRDLLLGREVDGDFDLTTDAVPDDIELDIVEEMLAEPHVGLAAPDIERLW